MPRKGITKKDVILSANALIAQNRVPTAAGIREYLGRGSLTTIQKYFRAWKLSSFKGQQEEKRPENMVNETTVALQNKVEGSEERIKVLMQELMKKERESVKLNQENTQLIENLKEQSVAYKDLFIKHEELSKSYQDLKEERTSVLQNLLDDKNNHIERLKAEIQAVHEKHLATILELGRKGDELLIEEKVKTINLSDKLKDLQQRIKSLEERLQKADKAKEPLHHEIKKQQALIKQYISWEQIQSFEQQ